MYRGSLTEILRKFTYGFYIVAAKGADGYAAGAVNWLSQASFFPPLIMMAIKKDSHLHDAIKSCSCFSVNVMSKDQEHVLPEFFKHTHFEGGKINGLPFQEGKTNSPIFVDCPASLECEVVEGYEVGDHTVIIGEIISDSLRYKDAEPLVDKDTDYKYAG